MFAYFKKGLIFTLVLVLSLASLPFTNVYAAGATQEEIPPQTMLSEFRAARLERVWRKQQRVYERLGKLFDGRIEARFQTMIDRAKEKGFDVTALEGALEIYQDAIKNAHPIFENCKGIINSHQGFDGEGKVTALEKAGETVQDMGEKLREIKSILDDPLKDLREAFRQFRKDNKPDGRPTQDADGG